MGRLKRLSEILVGFLGARYATSALVLTVHFNHLGLHHDYLQRPKFKKYSYWQQPAAIYLISTRGSHGLR